MGVTILRTEGQKPNDGSTLAGPWVGEDSEGGLPWDNTMRHTKQCNTMS